MNITLPIAQFDYAYHLGRFEGRPNTDRSFEGACLSASHVPCAWEKIAKLGGSPLWELRKTGAQFLDYHELGKHRRRAIMRWAEANGLVRRKTMFQTSYYDDELETEMCSLSETYAEAAAEIYDDEDGRRPTPIRSWETLPLLTERYLHRQSTGYAAVTWAVLAFAEYAGLDGVWWNDILDPSGYSAPRIGIFRSRLPDFSRKQLHQGSDECRWCEEDFDPQRSRFTVREPEAVLAA